MNTKKFQNEFILQKNTQNNLDIFNLKFIASEFQSNRLRVDTLAFDENNDEMVIIEYKIRFDRNVLNQAEKYYRNLKENKHVYIDRYNEKSSSEMTDFDKAKVMIIGPEFSENQIKLAQKADFPLEIWKVTLFKDNRILYEMIGSDKSEEISVTDDDLIITDKDLLENRTQKVTDLYTALVKRVTEEFPTILKRNLIDAFSFKVNNKFICNISFLIDSFNVYFYSKNLNDNSLTDISDKTTGGNANYQFNISSENDINHFMKLFKEVYEEKL